ncbi:MAG: ECF transporter S component [Solirubrobacteraceae bacterium]
MSWQLASFALLALALGGGLAWYERSAPSSRSIALVGTLAALAALGRLAFAPLPDVKPTTDIVLLAGFALGAAPGFAIGAVAALASNMFFGQGPWTPWQMFAWGLIGVLGAGVGALTHHAARRFTLVCACALAGALFGLILNFSTWITFAGPPSLDRFLAVQSTALPFDVAHVVGNVIFCLAFGPAFARALLRFRARLEIRWEPLVAPALVLALALSAGAVLSRPAPAAAQSADATAHTAALARQVSYLIRAQNPDGGFGAAPNVASSQLFTSWAALGLAAAGRDPRTVRRASRSARDYMLAKRSQLSGIGDAERTVLALAASRTRAPRALSRQIRQAKDGSFAGQVNLTAFGILARRAVGSASGVKRALTWLLSQQNPDGGFNFASRGGGSGIDDTAGALQALVAAGLSRSGRPAQRAAEFILAHQNSDGGFPLSPGDESNAQSTAWAVQALVAAGRDPIAVRRGGSRDPLAFIDSLTASDGAVRYSRTSAQTPVWVTAQALTALAMAPFPIRPRHRASVADLAGLVAATL